MPKTQPPSPSVVPWAGAFQSALLAWYNKGHRAMPWREATATPYPIWLAETMLQQTTVTAVIPYYHRFLEHFPTLQTLAAAPLEEVLHLWQGLGYYRRAHLLHACAKAVVGQYGGHFPGTEAELLTLPGLGPYTAAVLAATAFNTPANVVDGNVERVISRLFAIDTPLPAARATLRAHAATLASAAEPRLYANAIMELGSQVCTPRNPQCLLCPAQAFCKAYAQGHAETYPHKAAKKPIPHLTATVWLITDPTGALYLQQRPATGLMANLWELPHSGWEPKARRNQPAPVPLVSATDKGTITHTLTHLKLTLEVLAAESETPHPAANAFRHGALPPLSTLMKKALMQGLKEDEN